MAQLFLAQDLSGRIARRCAVLSRCSRLVGVGRNTNPLSNLGRDPPRGYLLIPSAHWCSWSGQTRYGGVWVGSHHVPGWGGDCVCLFLPLVRFGLGLEPSWFVCSKWNNLCAKFLPQIVPEQILEEVSFKTKGEGDHECTPASAIFHVRGFCAQSLEPRRPADPAAAPPQNAPVPIVAGQRRSQISSPVLASMLKTEEAQKANLSSELAFSFAELKTEAHFHFLDAQVHHEASSPPHPTNSHTSLLDKPCLSTM